MSLGWLDYGFRFYDPVILRFTTIDPLTEKNHSQSGFVYAANNPINYIDFLGLDSLAAAEVTQAAENAVETITEEYGSSSAQCNRGVNEAFTEITESEQLKGKTANEIVSHMESSDEFEEVELKDVQDEANEGEIVIAGKTGTKHGHVAMAVPGDEVTSGSWGGKAPVGMDTGGGKRWSKNGMNYSWTSKSGVKFYKYTGSSNKTYNAGTLGSVTVRGQQLQKLKPISAAKVLTSGI